MTPNFETAVANALASTQARLDRLETYLRDDPNNPSLLQEAFATALQCQQRERAQFHLRHALALEPNSLPWALRECDFWLAQGAYEPALQVLQRLQTIPNPPAALADTLLHNTAFIAFQQGRYPDCTALLQHRMDLEALQQDPALLQSTAFLSLGKLWLRALHHAGELEHAVQWAHQLAQAQQLHPAIAGVASLAALDHEQFGLAQQWSTQALEHAQEGDKPLEALVTLASLALGERNAPKAQALAVEALRLQPGDGRAWSALAFADLLAGDPATACQHFGNAIKAMPGHIGTWHGLGWAQLVQHQLPAAQSTFETALALDRNFADSHGGLAVVLALQQQTAQAQEHAKLALRLDPASLTARFAQALLQGDASTPERFEALARKLLGSQPAPVGTGSLWDGVLESMAAKAQQPQ